MVQRGITAIFFVAIMLGGLYGGRYSFVALFALVTVLCLWEFLGLTLEKTSRRSNLVRKVLGIGLGLTPFAWMSIFKLDLMRSPLEFVFYSAILFSPFIFSVFIFELFAKAKQPFSNIAFIFLGMIYLGMPFALLDVIAFEGEYFYADVVFGILAMNWLNDTGAYLAGSFFGKTPLMPRISPKKTWEGTIGGLLMTLLVAWALYLVFDDLELHQWLILGLIVAVFGTIGDLVESMLKRSLNVKDTGDLLPGHGGLLDRFDAFIFIIPFATAYLLWLR